MTKAAICTACADIVSPYRDWQADRPWRSWRWCECEHVGVRWRDSARGLLEVASLHGAEGIRVLGLNNQFLTEAVRTPAADAAGWRAWHAATCSQVAPHYLFHAQKRACWAVVVRPGESGDVFLMDYGEAWKERAP
jgi:hypothetical protein